jgi:uncharacterized repeat protein (TIGR01451 family)
MFKKLLANLPFNPGLIDQVTFYGRRMKQESSIRRAGFIFISLGFVVQLVAVMSPAQNSLAASSNDILDGITTKASILKAWDANTGNIQAIYGKFGITKANIAAIPGEQPNVTLSSTFRDYWSVGRLPLKHYGIDDSDEVVIHIDGKKIYQRPLHDWDTHGSSKYKAFQGKNKYGEYFWILQSCGNPTFVGQYLPPPPSSPRPKPKLEIHKQLLSSNSTVQPGDTVRFHLEYQNVVPESLATNFKLSDSISNDFEFVSFSSDNMKKLSDNGVYTTKSGSLGSTDDPRTATLTVKVKNSVADGKSICNSAQVTSDQDSATSERPCITVTVPKNPSPSGSCIASTKLEGGSSNDFVIRTSADIINAQITGYDYYLDGSSSRYAHDQTGDKLHDKKISGIGSGTHTVRVYVDITGTNDQVTRTDFCEAKNTESPKLNQSKTVKDITQGSIDADGIQVDNGDILEFTLSTENITDSDYINYAGKDDFGNILQYADLVDTSQLTNQGITLDGQNNLNWTVANIKAHSSDVKKIKVQVKKSIPSTNNPSTMSPDYNCAITNFYGNQVSMTVDCSQVKTLAKTAENLPNTGPGTSAIIGGVVTMIAGYLFMRSRITARELELVRQDYISSGGL